MFARAPNLIGIGKAIRGCITVDDPKKPTALSDHRIGVAIKREKGRDLLYPIVDLPMEQNAAIGGQVLGQKNSQRGLVGGKNQFVPQRADRNAAASLIGGVNILIAGGVI